MILLDFLSQFFQKKNLKVINFINVKKWDNTFIVKSLVTQLSLPCIFNEDTSVCLCSAYLVGLYLLCMFFLNLTFSKYKHILVRFLQKLYKLLLNTHLRFKFLLPTYWIVQIIKKKYNIFIFEDDFFIIEALKVL